MPSIGFGELVVILAIALLVFGPKRLPDVAKGIGRSLNAFKEGLKEVTASADAGKSESEGNTQDKRT